MTVEENPFINLVFSNGKKYNVFGDLFGRNFTGFMPTGFDEEHDFIEIGHIIARRDIIGLYRMHSYMDNIILEICFLKEYDSNFFFREILAFGFKGKTEESSNYFEPRSIEELKNKNGWLEL
jgi:hypothetical protein